MLEKRRQLTQEQHTIESLKDRLNALVLTIASIVSGNGIKMVLRDADYKKNRNNYQE
ncbi:hypothetical protein [Zobellia russellii]|uniref:hypothetical protein n=1 Tax=Zobellia russellii TaxID=248907 RepID=UPI001BFF690F|nr:hypothetical protein [Zobellia russellii]MBT9189274.1 hypothetical protein [Zobellia russellii]